VGTAAADVVHLLAELIENATMFSPSTTRVEVRASRVGNGFAVEIEDRGIGIPPDTIAGLNQRLSSPPEFDIADTDQLGLFVVGRLASRHGIRIALRESAYGGVTAIVLLPHSLVLGEEDFRVPADGRHAGPAHEQGLVPEPAFGLTGRRQALPGPPEAPRFMGPALPPHPAAPVGGTTLTAGAPSAPWLVTADSGAPGGPQPADPPTGPIAPTGWQPAGGDPAGGGEYRGLPRRVRQANLAPQLRQDPPGPAGQGEPEATAALLRSPDEARAMMAALQHGWQRGREDDPAEEQPAAGTDPGTAPAEGEESS
jgi:hypothetical protein